MSILNRLGLTRSPGRCGLAAIWTDAAISGRQRIRISKTAPPAGRDSSSCLPGWKTSAPTRRREADEGFPAERLAAQHAQIFRRLEAAERPARVIAFPGSRSH